jgi:hypothetical protein
MTKSAPTRLLTTRFRISLAFGVTALGFILNLHWSHKKSQWLFTAPFLHEFWPLLVANTLLYAYFCWLAFWFIRGTNGAERVFIVGWFTGILLWPLPRLWPQWSAAVAQIGTLGLAVALLASLSLLLKPSEEAN